MLTSVRPARCAFIGGLLAALSLAACGDTPTAPSGANQPPVIGDIRSTGSRLNQPSGFADLGEIVQLSAAVTDRDLSASSVQYVWEASAGTISGQDAHATWQLPAALPVTPAALTARLSVIETYFEGGAVQRNTATRVFTLSVHDSQKEILALGQDFLDLFSQSQYTAAEVVHSFSTTCDGGRGRADEFSDVAFHRQHYVMQPGWSVTQVPPVTFNFGGQCLARGALFPADACSRFAVHWYDVLLVTDDRNPSRPVGSSGETMGIDYVTAVLEGNQWRLCHSTYQANAGASYINRTRRLGIEKPGSPVPPVR